MLLTGGAQLLSPFILSDPTIPTTKPFPFSMTFTLLRSPSSSHNRHRSHPNLLLRTFTLLTPSTKSRRPSRPPHLSLPHTSSSLSTFVEHLPDDAERRDFSGTEFFDFDSSFGSTDLNQLNSTSLSSSTSPSVEVKQLEELPEQWRRSRLAWLCKELPSQKQATMERVLNAQRKWITQEDVTYLVVHCLRIREPETGFKVYKWMVRQHWFQFDFALATKLADSMGRERKYLKCQDIFDEIINKGLIPNESTFHILTVSYLSASGHGYLQEACSIYNQMIQLGSYRPQLGLHNSLFRALVSKPGDLSKHHLKQAEFIFQNLTTSGLEIHRDIYGGLIWLHSFQDTIDKKRIASLRAEMQLAGIEESREVLVSILRACSKEGDVEEAERTWTKLLNSDTSLSSQALAYMMEVYARVGQPMKSLEIFRGRQKQLGSTSAMAFQKIIEVLCKAQEIELAESVMIEFINSGLKPLVPSFADIMDMYFNSSLHGKLESTFFQSLEKCPPNRTIYNIYLNSLVEVGSVDKAEEIFNQMYSDGAIGVNARSCNAILRSYLSIGEFVKAEKIYDLMCQKRYAIEDPLMQKLDYVLSLNKKVVKKPPSLKLSKEQREILMGLLLGGLRIESDDDRKKHVICFQFNENSSTHFVLKRHIHDQYHEWLASFSKMAEGNADIPCQFTSISHSYFGFFADQFWPKGQAEIPKLIHRWLSPRVLAYWYMYGGHRTSSGDILLKLKGSREGIDRIVKALKINSLDCRVKRKGRVFWIGFLGSNSTRFWKLVEPFILDDLKDRLKASGQSSDQIIETPKNSFDSRSDSNEKDSDYSDDGNT